MENGYENERVEEVERYGIMDTPWDETYDGYTKLAATLFDTPVSIISIVDKDRIWVKSGHGMEGGCQLNRESGLCNHTILGETPHVVEDTLQNEDTINHSFVHGNLGIRFYAGVPLRTRSGFNLGSFCIMDKQPREFSAGQLNQLAALAKLLMDYIELVYLQKNTLLQQRDTIKKLAHDLKNPLTIITLQSELLMDEEGVTEDIVEMSQQISVAGRKINDIINKRLFS